MSFGTLHRLSVGAALACVLFAHWSSGTARALASVATATPALPASTPTATPSPTPSRGFFGMSQAAAQPGGEKPIQPMAPPDGKWLKDEQGREYFVHKISKKDPFVLGVEGLVLKMRWHMEADLVGQDEKDYFVKWYRPTEDATGPRVGKMDAQQQREVIDSLRPVVKEVDRIEFRSFADGLPTEGQWREGFKLADFNQDGHLDIVHGMPRKANGTPVVFTGDSSGHWSRMAPSFPRLPYDYGDVAVADFNGDGKPDLALAMHIRGLLVLASDARDGSYRNWSEGLPFEVAGRGGSASGFAARTIEAGDWNRDGRLDLITLGEGPRMAASSDGPKVGQSDSFGLVVSLNQGDGTWKRLQEGTGAGNIFGDSLAVGDLDGDGHLDVVTASGIQGRKDLLNYGVPEGTWTTRTVDGLPDDSYVRSVAVGDFDSDERLDFALGYLTFAGKEWTTGIDLFLNRGERAWERHQLVGEPGRDGFSALAAGDLDGDGKLDVVALRGNGGTLVLLGDGKGGAMRELSPELTVWQGCEGSRAGIADLDGDGANELVTSFAGEPSGFADPGRCLNNGGIQAWKPVVKSASKP